MVSANNDGQFYFRPLIHSEAIVSQDGSPADVTCFESRAESVYIGTSAGEIMHFFRADDGNGGADMPTYIIASWQKTYTKKPRRVSKILLLPTVGTALALSASITSVFTLPEFAPCEVGQMRDVRCITRDIDQVLHEGASNPSPDGVHVTVFTKQAIRVVGVRSNALKSIHKIDYKGVIIGVRRSSYAVVSNGETYDLLDLENVQKIPLVPVITAASSPLEEELTSDSATIQSNGSFEVSGSLRPHIFPIGVDEFLITTGTKIDEPSVGLVVNTNGDITRGTFSWNGYPTSLAADEKHVVVVIDKQVLVYDLLDQTLVHTLTFDTTPFVSRVYSSHSVPDMSIVDVLRLVPLGSKDQEFQDRIDQESNKLRSLAKISSSIMIYSKSDGLGVLMSRPQLRQYEESIINGNIDHVASLLGSREINTELGVLEFKYLNMIVALGYILHEEFDKFEPLSQSLDPRILLFLVGSKDIVGDIWVPNGVLPVVDKIKQDFKKLPFHLNEKFLEFYYQFISRWLKKKQATEITGDVRDKYASLELSKLRLLLDPIFRRGKLALVGNELNNMIDQELTVSYPQCIEIFEEYERYFDLSRLYRHKNIPEKVLSVWKKLLSKDPSDKKYTDDRFISGEDRMCRYLADLDDEDLVWTNGIWLIKHFPNVGIKLFMNPDTKIKFDDAKVVDELRKLDDDEPWRRFLKYLVYEKKSKLFVKDVIAFMVHDIIDKLGQSIEVEGKPTSYAKLVKEGLDEYKSLTIPRRSYVDFLRGQKLQGIPGSELTSMRLDLVHLLSTDKNYDVDKILKILESNDAVPLILEKCIIYDRLDRKNECLSKLINELNDYISSIQYTRYGVFFIAPEATPTIKGPQAPTVYPASAPLPVQQQLLATVFENFMAISDKKTRQSCIRLLLEKGGVNLDLQMVLASPVDSWPLEMFDQYLSQWFRQLIKVKNNSVLRRSVARSENVFVTNQLAGLKNKIPDGGEK